MQNKLALGEKSLNPIGLGSNKIKNTSQAQALILHALQCNVNFFDTANVYHHGEAEIILSKVLRPYMNKICLATKGGFEINTSGKWRVNGTPEAIVKSVNQSLHRMKIDSIELYQLHRIDPHVPLEESIGALRQLQVAGKIQYIGLSEVSVEELKKAQQEATIASVQNYYNLCVRKHNDVLDYCTNNAIIFIPFYPLGSMENRFPLKMQKTLMTLAEELCVLPQQIALAWLLSRSKYMLPIPGTSSIPHLKENMQSAHLKLSSRHIEFIEHTYNQLNKKTFLRKLSARFRKWIWNVEFACS